MISANALLQVRSGMLILPNPKVPNAVWEVAETEEMKEVIGLYGKTFHFWQVDRGDMLPLGMPQLMMSFTKDEQVRPLSPEVFFFCSVDLAADGVIGSVGEGQG